MQDLINYTKWSQSEQSNNDIAQAVASDHQLRSPPSAPSQS